MGVDLPSAWGNKIMNNHWLAKSKIKKLLNDIDDIGTEVWSNDGSLKDFFDKLTKEQKDFFMSLDLSDFICDINQDLISIELTCPR